MIRVLLIENEPSSIDAFEEEVRLASLPIDLVITRSRDGATLALESADFDVVVCDLFIPSEDDAADESDDFGVAALREARGRQPHAIALILSGFGTWDNIGTLVNRPEVDVFGSGPIPMVQHTSKKDYSVCIAALRMVAAEIDALDGVPIDTAVELSSGDRRALQSFVRSREGSRGSVTVIESGLSGALTLRLESFADGGRLVGTVFVKVDAATRVDDEEYRYGRHVTGILPPGSFAQVVKRFAAGHGRAALVSGMITGSLRSLHDVIRDDESLACSIVERVRQMEKDTWLLGASNRDVRVGDVRRARGVDDDLVTRELNGVAWREFEEVVITESEAVQHGDLHGENVLVDPADRAFLVDFAATGPAGSCLDPVVLEMGLLFHTKGRAVVGGWPSGADARNWADLDRYLQDCPKPDFVRSVREWAVDVAPTRHTLLATAYAHAVRQLKFVDVENGTVKDLVAGLVANW